MMEPHFFDAGYGRTVMLKATSSDKILERITSLPPLPTAVGRLLRLVNEPDVEFKEIARTISLDPSLTAQLLRVANSAYYGFSQQVQSVHQATVILGRYALRNMALSLAMIRLRGHMKQIGPLTPEEFWRHCMAVACGARMLARHSRKVAAEEAFVAGLLHDIGKLVFIDYDRAGYGGLLRAAARGPAPLHTVERQVFGIDHAYVGAALCRHWDLPENISAGVAGHHGTLVSREETLISAEEELLHGEEGLLSREENLLSGGEADRELADIVALADSLAKICRIGTGGDPHVGRAWLNASAIASGNPDRLRHVVDALAEEAAVNEQIFFNRTGPMHLATDNREMRPIFRLAIEDPSTRSIIELALRSRHCTVATSDHRAADVVIADRPPTEGDRLESARRNVLFRSVPDWLAHGEESDVWINVERLHSWLSDILVSEMRRVG